MGDSIKIFVENLIDFYMKTLYIYIVVLSLIRGCYRKSSQMLIPFIEWSFAINSPMLHILLSKLLEVQSLLVKTLSTSQLKHK
jgi:hypothetical protein